MLSQIKTEIAYWVDVLTSNVLPAFIDVNYFIHGVGFKRFYFLFENFPCYFLSFSNFLFFVFFLFFVLVALGTLTRCMASSVMRVLHHKQRRTTFSNNPL